MRVSQSCRPNDLVIQGEDLAENYETIQSHKHNAVQKKKLDSTGKIDKLPSMELNTVGIKSKLASKRGTSNKKQGSQTELDMNSNGTIRADKANYAGTIDY